MHFLTSLSSGQYFIYLFHVYSICIFHMKLYIYNYLSNYRSIHLYIYIYIVNSIHLTMSIPPKKYFFVSKFCGLLHLQHLHLQLLGPGADARHGLCRWGHDILQRGQLRKAVLANLGLGTWLDPGGGWEFNLVEYLGLWWRIWNILNDSVHEYSSIVELIIIYWPYHT